MASDGNLAASANSGSESDWTIAAINSVGGMVDLSRDVSDLAAIYNLLGFEAPSFVDHSAFHYLDVDVPATCVDAHIQSEAPVIGVDCLDADQDLRKIVDDMFCSPPSASLGRFPTSRLTRQVKPKLAEVPEDIHSYLDSVDVVRYDSFTRVGKKGDSTELIPGLLGTGKMEATQGSHYNGFRLLN